MSPGKLGKAGLEQRALGNSGLLVSVVGLGCNNFGGRIDLEATRKVVHKALDLGITFFDEADTYGDPRGNSETCLGQILGDRRKDIVLATKFARPMDGSGRYQGASRRYIMAEVEASLRRLRTDWIDLYQQHQPDPLTPIEETLRALDDLVRQGKVRYIGSSTLAPWQVVEAHWTAKYEGLNRYVSCQEEYSLLARGLDRDMMPVLQSYGLGLIPFRPLADGLLTGKYRRDAALPAGTRLGSMPRAAEPLSLGRELGDCRAARRVRRRARAYAARTGDLLARLPADGGQRHRRRHAARAGRTERGRRGLGADRRRDGRNRPADRSLTNLQNGGSTWKFGWTDAAR